MDNIKKHSCRKLEGVVVSDKMQKTRVVAIEHWKKLKKYLKYIRTIRKFKAHDENDQYKTGDKVIIEETRPLSREKRWKIIKKLGSVKTINKYIVRHLSTKKHLIKKTTTSNI